MLTGDRLFLGAGRGIGLAMLKLQLQLNSQDRFFVLYRDPHHCEDLAQLQEQYSNRLQLFQADPTLQVQWPSIAQWLSSFQFKLGHLFNSVGFLSNHEIKPEKSIRDFNQTHLLEYFRVNATTLPIALTALKPFYSREKPMLIASISAKVGSISDNQLGGWYGYRASKAAHNMLIKTLSIEFQRLYPKACLISLHPGTVETGLSQPFSQNVKHQIFTPEECSQHLYKILERSGPEQTGQFFSWDGSIIPW